MSKGKIYSLAILLLSFVIVISGWFLTKRLLDVKETEILSGEGIVYEKSPEKVYKQENIVEENDFIKSELDEDGIAKILKVWEDGGKGLPQEPQENQINMEQAISNGKSWIATLTVKGALPDFLSEGNFDKINAKLYTLDEKVPFDKTLIDFWQVIYEKEDIQIILCIHAASGQVWEADISMNEERELNGSCTDEEILETAFPLIAGKEEETRIDGHVVYKSFDNKKIYAALKRDRIVIDKQDYVVRLMLWLTSDIKIKKVGNLQLSNI